MNSSVSWRVGADSVQPCLVGVRLGWARRVGALAVVAGVVGAWVVVGDSAVAVVVGPCFLHCPSSTLPRECDIFSCHFGCCRLHILSIAFH